MQSRDSKGDPTGASQWWGRPLNSFLARETTQWPVTEGGDVSGRPALWEAGVVAGGHGGLATCQPAQLASLGPADLPPRMRSLTAHRTRVWGIYYPRSREAWDGNQSSWECRHRPRAWCTTCRDRSRRCKAALCQAVGQLWGEGLPLQSTLPAWSVRYLPLSTAHTYVSVGKEDLLSVSGQRCSAVVTLLHLEGMQHCGIHPFSSLDFNGHWPKLNYRTWGRPKPKPAPATCFTSVSGDGMGVTVHWALGGRRKEQGLCKRFHARPEGRPHLSGPPHRYSASSLMCSSLAPPNMYFHVRNPTGWITVLQAICNVFV